MLITPQRLGRLTEASVAKFEFYRQNRLRFISQYVGRFYRQGVTKDDGETRASPLNLMHQAITTTVPNLVFNTPRARVTSQILEYRSYAEMLALAVGQVSKDAGLRETLRKVVVDAMFFAGFIKTGLAVGDKIIQIEGYDMPVGEPFAERVDPDDMILDPMARDWDEQEFIGNRFRLDIDQAIQSGMGDPDELEKMARDVGYTTQVKVAADISTKALFSSEEPRRYIDMVELFIPKENRIVTMPYKPGQTFDKFTHDREWDGPRGCGPYHMLGFAYVPDNLLPVAPAGIWYDLHIMGNKMARKLASQAARNKRVLAYEDDAEEDVEQIADAADGETVRVTDVNKIKEVEYGGVSDQVYTHMEWIKRNFSEQAGSLELLSGAGAAAPTATQSEMLQANSSVRIGDMQGEVYAFVAKVMKDIGYYLHTDPLINLPLVRRVEGVEKQEIYTPEMRQGDFFDYNLEVEPFSMARPDPAQAVRRRLEFATNVIPAAAQAAQMMGPGFNVGAYLARMAKEVGIEDADEWLNIPEIGAWLELQVRMKMAVGSAGKAGAGQPAAPPADPNAQMQGQVTPNPGQPNPSQMGPSGGISPETEVASAQQEAAGASQASARALGMIRG